MKISLTKFVAVLVAIMGVSLNAGIAQATTLGSSSVSLSDPRPSVASSYTFTGGASGAVVQSVAVKCIKVTFSTSSSSVTTPTGFTAAGAAVSASSTLINSSTSGWTPTAAANNFTYTNGTGVTPTTTSGATFILTGITNSSVADTQYWYKLTTYGNTDCSSSPLDNGTAQFINTNGSTVSLTVDQSLSFTVNQVLASQSCAGGTTTQASTATTVPFGTVTSAANGIVCQDLTAATNASNGYTIYTRSTGALANGLPGQTIADFGSANTAPGTVWSAGTEDYGYSTNDTTLGTGTAGRFASNKFAGFTTSNAEVAYEAAGVTSTTYRIAHEVGISTTTKPGTYQTTVIYTCTPVY